MNIENQLNYLFNLERDSIKYDLNNINSLCKALNNPQEKFKSIHIAGTNGKGSVAAMTVAFLMEAGFNTGLYMSPHVNVFNERISVNGILIEDEFIINFLESNRNIFDEIKPSFFEATTAMAFEYFAIKKIEYAVLETGLGGRLDATNIVKPVATAITTIGLDHAEYLGETLESVAYEKAGIIKENVPCITGDIPGKAMEIIKDTCIKKKSLLVNSFCGTDVKISYSDNPIISIRFYNEKFDGISYPIKGKYQIQNLKTALELVRHVFKKNDLKFSNELIQNSLNKVVALPSFRGRFEMISEEPKILVDVAHNPQALRVLRESLVEISFNNLIIIYGVMDDKDIKSCVDELKKFNPVKFILTKTNIHRAFEPLKLADFFSNKGKCITTNNLQQALSAAGELVSEDDLLLVTGSFYIVGDFLTTFSKYKLSNE